jgi:diaminopimelate decarboxylase
VFELSLKFNELKYINIGGGVGIQYRPEEKVIDIERLYGRVRELSLKDQYKTGRKIEIWIEPGRFLVGDCGILLCRFTARKQTP